MNSNQCILVWASDNSLEKEKIYIYCKCHITEFANATVWTTFSKKSGVIKKGHAHKQTMMRLFEFLSFYYSFLLLTVFFLKEAVHQRAFCSYIVIFLQRKILYNLFFFSKQYPRNIIYTHYYSLYYDHLFPMPSSGDNSWSVCQLGRTYSLNINQRVALTDL